MTARVETTGPVQSQDSGGRSRSSVIWIQGLACGALLTFAAPTALLLAVLFAPAVVCVVAEVTGRTGVTRAVALGCAAASLGPAWHLWIAGDRMDQAFVLLTNPVNLSLAWGAGACSWAMCQVVPVLLARLWDARETTRRHAIEAEIQQHLAQWTLDDD